MDKNVYNMKAEKIQKAARRGDYETAAKICDTIDWSQISSVRMLTLVSGVYEAVKDYDRAIDVLLMAYEEAPVGKRYLYKLTELALAAGSIREAEEYYKNYLKEAPQDPSRYLLRYQLAETKGESIDKKIAILEAYKRVEFEEEWACRLAELYMKNGQKDECVRLCDEIILWFGVGPYVDRAMELKEQFEPLTASQQERRDNKSFYEANLARMAREAEVDDTDVSGNPFTQDTPEAQAPSEDSEDDLPRVAISDDMQVSFDESAFITEEEEKANEHKAGEEKGVFSIGSFVESVMADAVKQQENTVLAANARAEKEAEEARAARMETLVKTEFGTAEHAEPELYVDMPGDAAAGAAPEVEVEHQPETEPEFESGLQSETEAEPEIEVELQPEAEAEPEIEVELQPEMETGLEMEAEIQPESETEPEIEVEAELQPEMNDDILSDSETEPEIQAEVPCEAESETLPEFEPEVELEVTIPDEDTATSMVESPEEPEPQQLELVWEDVPEESEELAEEEEAPQEPEAPAVREFLYVGCANPEEGLNLAIDALKKAYEDFGGDIGQVAKISGTKLNHRGLLESLPNLVEKDLIIVGANTLSDKILREMKMVSCELDPDKFFVLMDRPAAIYRLKERLENLPEEEEDLPSIKVSEDLLDSSAENPKAAVLPEAEEEEIRVRESEIAAIAAEPKNQRGEEPEATREIPSVKRSDRADYREPAKRKPAEPVRKDAQMSEDAFIDYLKQYAESIDCVIQEKAMNAIYDVVDEIIDDGDELSRAMAEEVVEDAADEAERHSLRNLFCSRYTKDGKLILRARHFK